MRLHIWALFRGSKENSGTNPGSSANIARLKNPENAARRFRAASAASLLLAILFLPSLWMLRTVPPLWRDIDAYLQVTEPPVLVTILQFAPLYCFLARVPLYLGYTCHCLRAGLALPSLHFFAEPTLTDSGVALLLLGQHLALCCAAYLLIVSTARPFVLRAVLAMMWATNPLFYAFAHCVGSEALSLILLLLLATTGIRIVRQPVKAPVTLWLASGLLISLSMLTRHVNGVLAALLPLAISFAGLSRCWRH